MHRKATLFSLGLLLAGPFARAEAERTIERTFNLSPDAEVELGGFNGRLEIETTPGAQASVAIHRTARSDSDFDDRPVILEQIGNRLVIKVESGRDSRGVKDEVFLTLPESVSALEIGGVNGRVSSGFIQGSTSVSGINGPVSLVQAGGRLEASGINGAVEVEIGPPAESGVHFEGINGAITIVVPRGAGFEVDARSKNGKVVLDVADAQIETDRRDRFHAVVAGGGPPVTFEGINGRIQIRH